MVALETPVLSVAIDAVSKVDGEKALCGLITLFSKCKAGIQDGPRLENMAWRLWHVERFERSPSTHHLCFPASTDASSPGRIASPITSCPSSASSSDSASQSSGSVCSDQEDVECWDKDELTAVTSKSSPLLATSLPPLSDLKNPTHPVKKQKVDMKTSASSAPRRNSRSRERSRSRDRNEARHSTQAHCDEHQTDQRPSFSTRRTHSNTSVGKIMADLLPEKLDVMGLDARRRRPSNSSTTSAVSDSTAAISLTLTTKDLSEEDRWRASSSTLVRDDQESAIVTTEVPVVIQQVFQPQHHLPPPQLQQGGGIAQLTLSTGSTSGSLLVTESANLPNVVIVHPTPHHTPPMTPQGSVGSGLTTSHSSVACGPCAAINAIADAASVPNTSGKSPSLAPADVASGSSSGQLRRDRDQRERERDSLAVPTRAQARQQLLVLSDQQHVPHTSDRDLVPSQIVFSTSTSTRDAQSLGEMPCPPSERKGVEHATSQASQPHASNSSALSTASPTMITSRGKEQQLSERCQKEQDTKFFISGSNGGSQDGDSPETSASSQIGSHSVVSGSVSVSNSGFTGEPASIASRTSTASQAKSTSSGRTGSSRGGLKMRMRNGDAKGKGKGKGKGREAGLGTVQFAAQPPMRRSTSGHRFSQQVGDIGTMHRSVMGGKTAAATALNNSIRLSMNNHSHVIPQERHSVQQPPTSATSKASQRSEKPVAGPGPSTTTTANGTGGLKSPASSSSGRRGSSQSRSRPNAGSRLASNVSGLKAGAPSTSAKHKIEMVDDSEYSTDEDWDTEDASDDVEEATDDGHQQEGEGKLAEAAAEAQRHRDLFAKVDRRSYTQLNRSQSGLLSQIFHPPPERFPLDHPYRYSRSTQDILAHVTQGPARQFYMPGAMTAMQAQPKSSVAMPTQANVVAQGVGSPNNTRKSPLRKPPQDAEMESDSGDDTENKLDMSISLAQKKLMEHMTRSSSKQRQQQQGEQSKIAQQRPPNTQQQLPPHQELPRSNTFANSQQTPYHVPSNLPTVATAPIDLGYPYNLPMPMPPSTPRTTRRKFLTNELSESLRRNLLWERQVSKRPMGNRRTASTSSGMTNGQNGHIAPTTTKPEETQEERQQARRLNRNKSYQEDFHGAGW